MPINPCASCLCVFVCAAFVLFAAFPCAAQDVDPSKSSEPPFPCAAQDVAPSKSSEPPKKSSNDPLAQLSQEDPPSTLCKPQASPEPELRHHLLKVHATGLFLVFAGWASLGIGYEFAYSEWGSIAVNFGLGGAGDLSRETGPVFGFDVMALMTTPGIHRFVLGFGLINNYNYLPGNECWTITPQYDGGRFTKEECSMSIDLAFNLSYRYNPVTSPMFFEVGLANQSGMALGLKLSTGFTF
jgi:hypothetical protein